jgi:hypothetical protein
LNKRPTAAGERNLQIRHRGRKGPADRLFVGRVEKGEQQADRAGFRTTLTHLGGHTGQCLGAQRLQHFAVCADSLGHLESQLAGRQRRRVVGLEVVQARTGLTADLEEITETFRGDDGHRRPAALDERVGGHRRAVRKARHIGGSDSCGEQLVEA